MSPNPTLVSEMTAQYSESTKEVPTRAYMNTVPMVASAAMVQDGRRKRSMNFLRRARRRAARLGARADVCAVDLENDVA